MGVAQWWGESQSPGDTLMPSAICPQCQKRLSLPDELVGRKIRCKVCKAEFVANAEPATASGISSARRSGSMPRPSALSTEQAAAVPTVVAELLPPPAPGPLRWVVALLAFVVPVSAAAAFAYLNWKPSPATPGEGPAEEAPDRYAAIEIASKSVKYTIFDVYSDPVVGRNCRVLEEGSAKSEPIRNIDQTERFDRAELAKAIASVKQYHEMLLKKANLSEDHIAVFASPGLFEALNDKPRRESLVSKNKETLRDAVKDATEKTVAFIDPEDEAQYSLKGTVPKRYRDSALYIDVGTGAMRGAYLTGGVVRKFTGPGLGKFRDKVKKASSSNSFATTAQTLAPRELDPTFATLTTEHPLILSQERLYVVGGIVWVLANTMQPTMRGAYVPLSPDDIDQFYLLVRKDPTFLKTLEPPSSLSAEEATRFRDDVAKMQKIFSPEDLQAGAELLKSLAYQFQFGAKKEIVFYRNGNNAWLLAYLLKL